MPINLGAKKQVNYLSFDGVDDTVILRQENEITTSEINNELTISIEFIPNESEAGYVLWAADGSTPSRPSQMFSILNVDNTIEFNAFGGQLTIPLEIGKKYNITFTATANNEIKLYEDGQFVATSTTSNRNPANNMNIGSRSGDVGNTSQAFHSKVDVYNLQIWNKALTQQEIQGYIQTKPTGNETNLVAYYDFSDGQGTTLTDQAGNNDGTIIGATWGEEITDNIKDIRLGEDVVSLIFLGETLVYGSRTYELIADVNVTTATTQIDFDNLNITKDDELRLVFTLFSTTGTSVNCRLFVNGENTTTDYHSQRLQGSGSSLLPTRLNENVLVQSIRSARTAQGFVDIKVSNNDKFVAQSQYVRSIGSESSNIDNVNWNIVGSGFTLTSITSLKLSITSTNIAVGSRLQLYKVVR